VRNLQSELLRVGCGGNEQGADGNWSPAWQETLRRFNTSAHANLDPDQPSADAVALIHEQKGQVCPSGVAKSKSKSKPAHETEPRKTAARTQERSRREQARRPAESGERRAASAGNPPPLIPTVPGNPYRESYTYVGTKRCKTFEPVGGAPRIICP